MTLVIPPGFGNAALIFGSDTGTPPLITTIGVDLSAAGGDFVEAANVVFREYNTAMNSETWDGLTLERVSLLVGSDGGEGSVDSTEEPATMGRTLSTPPPVAMSAIARKVTNELGRRGRGRMFLPMAVAESEVNAGGQITEARVTSLTAAIQNFRTFLLDPVTGPALPPVLFHTLAPVDPTPIVGMAISPIVGWIRGRIR